MNAERLLKTCARPSVGCTEPAAVALAAATASQAIGGQVLNIDVVVDRDIFRNGLAVGVPGAGGQRGNLIAAALGALGGDPSLDLEVLRPVTQEHLHQANELLTRGAVAVRIDTQVKGPYVEATVVTSKGRGHAVISGSHTGIVRVEKNDRVIRMGSLHESSAVTPEAKPEDRWLQEASVSDLITCSVGMSEAALDYTMLGIEMNRRAAEVGVAQAPGLAIGARLGRQASKHPDCLYLRAQSMTAAAVDARMAGLPIQVMTSSGSGNQGLVTTLPIVAAAEVVKADRTRLGTSVALAHLLLARIGQELGLLSPLCGSAVQAAAAASAAITWLMGGTSVQVEHSAAVTLASQAAVLCDGAKASCALKAAQGAGAATEIALLTMDGLDVGRGNGLIGSGLLQTVADVRLLAQDLEGGSQHVLESITRNASWALRQP